MVSDPEDRDPLEPPLEEPSFYGHPRLGFWIMAISLGAVFWIGIGFDVFGSSLSFDAPGPYLFFGAIWLGVFGLARAFFSVMTSFRVTVVVAGLYLLIFLAGRIARGEL
jgi:apolipoprotein N-acyltransferase